MIANPPGRLADATTDVYSPKIGSTSQTQLNLANTIDPKFTLSWSHYLVRLSDKFTLP